MNYKICKLQEVDAYNYIQSLYLNNIIDSKWSYDKQHKYIRDLYIGFSSNSFIETFNKLGNKAEVIFWNCEILQKQWAKENNFNFNGKDWIKSILIYQLKSLQPDVLYFQNTTSLDQKLRKNIKNIIPRIKLVIIDEDWVGGFQDLSDSDILIAGTPILQKRYSYLNPHLLYHAFDENLLKNKRLINLKKKYELSFLGSLRFPESRYFFLKNLSNQFDINIWSRLNRHIEVKREKSFNIKKKIGNLIKKILSNQIIKRIIFIFDPKKIPSKILEIINAGSLLRHKKNQIPPITQFEIENENFELIKKKNFFQSVYGLDYYSIIKQSKILINKHADYASKTLDNMKMFETTGMGSCLVTDYGDNLKELFEDDYEVVTYKNMDEAKEKIKYLIDNPKIANEIGIKGQQKTLKKHSYFLRNCEIHEIIKRKL